MISFHPRHRPLWSGVIAVALIFALSLAVSVAGAGGPQSEFAGLQEMLRGNLDPQLRSSLEQKIAVLQREDQNRAAARSRAPTKPQNPRASQPAPVPDPPRRTGIIEGVMAPFSSQDVQIANLWQEKVNGQWVQVYAGALTSSSKQGLVIVVTETPTGVIAKRYLTPIQAGTMKIVQANGSSLTLKAANGVIFTFDVGSGAFASLGGQ